MEARTSSISSFKRFLFRILFPLVGITLVGGIIFQIIIEKNIILGIKNFGSYKVNRIIAETHLAEIPVFGSSRAEQSYMPSILGKTYFNYGISGVQDDVVLFFLGEECRKNKTTPVIINFDLDGVSKSKGEITNYIYNAAYPPVRALLDSDYTRLFRVPFVKYYGYYDYYFMKAVNSATQIRIRIDSGASLELKSPSPAEFADMQARRKQLPFLFHNDQRLRLSLFNMFAQNPKRLFYICVVPYHKSCFECPGSQLSDAKHFLDTLAAVPNVRVFDRSQAPYPDSLFFNTEHVNYIGAQRFSHELRKFIDSTLH